MPCDRSLPRAYPAKTRSSFERSVQDAALSPPSYFAPTGLLFTALSLQSGRAVWMLKEMVRGAKNATFHCLVAVYRFSNKVFALFSLLIGTSSHDTRGYSSPTRDCLAARHARIRAATNSSSSLKDDPHARIHALRKPTRKPAPLPNHELERGKNAYRPYHSRHTTIQNAGEVS